jgi:hypothetical protein
VESTASFGQVLRTPASHQCRPTLHLIVNFVIVVVVVLDVVLVFLLGVVLVVVHEHDLCTTARDDITGGLEDEEVGGVALEVNVGAEVDVGAPIAHARRERRPGDEASLDVVVGAIRDGARDDITGGLEVKRSVAFLAR